jgi:hypothetical protein
VSELGLKAGKDVYALIKTIAIDRQLVGASRRADRDLVQ